MRLPGVLGHQMPALLITALFYILIRTIYANSSPEGVLVCVEPKLRRCITWLTNVEEALELARKLYFNRDITRYCGVSDLVPIPPHQKYIMVVSKERNQDNLIFCKAGKIIVKSVMDQLWSKNKLKELYRFRRQTNYAPRGRYRGQTQSQYLAIEHGAGKDDGKAEAHSAADSSRASVSGSSGMGQAQSQTMYDPSCDDCIEHSNIQAENLKRGPFRAPQSSIPVGTSGNSGMLPSGVLGTSSQSRHGNFDSNGNAPVDYGSSHTNSLAPERLNQIGLPGNRGVFNYNQQGIPSGGAMGSSEPSNGEIPGRNTYFPGQVVPGSTGLSFNGGYNPKDSDGHGMSNNKYIPSMAGKPSGDNYGQNRNTMPAVTETFSPGQQRLPNNGNYITGLNEKPVDLGSTSYAPNQLIGNSGYGTGQPTSPGRVGNYGTNLNGHPTISAGYSPGQTVMPDGNIGYTQEHYPSPAGINPSGIVNNMYSPSQGMPKQNGAGTQGTPRMLGENLYTSSFPGGNSGHIIGNNWPINTGSFQAPDGTTYYCCVAGTNNIPQYIKNGGNLGFSVPFQGGTEGSDIPNNLIAPPGLYSLGPRGLATPATQFRTGTRDGPHEQLIPGVSAYPGPTGTDTQYLPGSQNGGRAAPGSSYYPDTYQSGILRPGVQYNSPKGTIGTTLMQSPGQQYSPIASELQSSAGQYGGVRTGVQNGLPTSGQQYSPRVINSQNGGPFQQYGPGMGEQNGLQNPSGQYNPEITGGQNGPGTGKYGPMDNSGQPGLTGLNGQYVPGTTMSQTGLPGTGKQYGPGPLETQSGIPNTGVQYIPSMIDSPIGQSGPIGSGATNGQNGLHNQGEQYSPSNTAATYGQNGKQTPTGQFGLGGVESQNGVQSPGGIDRQGGERSQTGQYSPGGPSGLPGLQIPGSIDRQQRPSGQYGSQGSSDLTGLQSPVGQYGHSGLGGPDSRQNPIGQFSPGSIIGPNGLQSPSNPYSPSGTGGQYSPIDQTNIKGQGSHPNGLGGSGSYSTGVHENNPYVYENQGKLITNESYNGVPQNVIEPNSAAFDSDDSEAEASVTQGGNGTVAMASSKGGNDKGRAQTHVHGAYTGSGSFSAQAEISGENKAANSEVTGDKKGASSQAQGSGRNNKSQANVQLGSETGSVLTGSQSEGIMHSSNTQVQGSVKGGMADAQARGPGSTSSQAQIGFTPYKEGDKLNEQQSIPFVGGGTASAQSSGRTGSSQSQLRGSFKYGITYNGAAQAGASLDKDAVFPNRLPFDKIDVYDENNKNINVNLHTTPNAADDTLTEETNTDKLPVPNVVPTEITPSSESPYDAKLDPDEVEEEVEQHYPEDKYGSHTHSDHHKDTLVPNPAHSPPIEGRRSFQANYNNNNADYDYSIEKDEHEPDDYDVDGYGSENREPSEVDQYEFSKDPETHQSLQSPKQKALEVRQTTGGNTQHIVLGSLNDKDAEITQKKSERPDESKVYQPGERVPGTGGYTIPIGFTGSVKSVASKENTYVIGTKDSPSQAQTVTLTPGSGKVKYTYPTTHPRNVSPKELRSLYNTKRDDNRYISVSKSVTRALDGENNIRKQYSHTYYTKSSSCGYFTFTCTMVSSSEGRKKVCKPKIPTNPDGTPMRC